MKINSESGDNFTVVNLDGKLETNTSPEAEVHLNGLIEAGESRIIVDFMKLDFVSSAGLRILLSTAKKLKANGGELRVCSLNETVQEIFDISGFGMLLSVFPNKSAATESWA
ncbi:MAG: anti-sigma B factor antagonist [Planctomycetota bacterium]|jgi:anti-sigma B factor antagonist